MMVSIQGVYRNGKIELVEPPENIPNETFVIVTFLEHGLVDLVERGIDETRAAELRGQLAAFAEDWDSAEMSVYDNYDAIKASL